MKIKISYAITVHNEFVELNRLLDQLVKYLTDDDEIVIQGDQGKVTDNVVSVIRKYHSNPHVKYIEYPLNRDFAAFKNNLLKNCTGDYIFQIDADELVSETLLENIKFLLFENLNIDLYGLPRLNIVIGLEDEYIQKWGWVKKKKEVSKYDYSTKNILETCGLRTDAVYSINWPDYQGRLMKNSPNIYWVGKVHERIHGITTYADLPSHDFDYSLFHVKHEIRQKQQNKFYETL